MGSCSTSECCLALKVQDNGSETHYYCIKKSIMVFWGSCRSHEASCLKVCIWQIDVVGCEEKDRGTGEK